MASSSTTSSSGGIGFAGLLTVAFIVLKLTHVIDWSWLWVLSPLWISVGIGLVILAVMGGILGVIALLDRRDRKRRRSRNTTSFNGRQFKP